MSTVFTQVNWKIIVTALVVVLVGAVASYGLLDDETAKMVISFLLGGAAGAAVPVSAVKQGGNV